MTHPNRQQLSRKHWIEGNSRKKRSWSANTLWEHWVSGITCTLEWEFFGSRDHRTHEQVSLWARGCWAHRNIGARDSGSIGVLGTQKLRSKRFLKHWVAGNTKAQKQEILEALGYWDQRNIGARDSGRTGVLGLQNTGARPVGALGCWHHRNTEARDSGSTGVLETQKFRRMRLLKHWSTGIKGI